MSCHIIVTRPAPDAQAWVEVLVGAGLQATALPLIDIRPARSCAPIADAWSRLPGFQAVMFVSATAVRHFFASAPTVLDCSVPLQGVQAWATGQGTVRALLAAGWPADAIVAPAIDAPQWDSEALWRMLQPTLALQKSEQTMPVLIARGADSSGKLAGRDWLVQQLTLAGVAVQTVSVYERHCPVWAANERACVDAFEPDALWVFSSSEAVAHLQTLRPGPVWEASRALTTHPRIAQAARDAGFGVVCESLPGLSNVIASIKSL